MTATHSEFFFDARGMILVETHCKGFFYLLSIIVRGKRKECVGSIVCIWYVLKDIYIY